MRGIVGYSGQKNALPILIEGLKRLEYKGYEGTGVAYQNGKGIEFCGAPGGAQKLQMVLPSPLPDAKVGIGYAEWTTLNASSSRFPLSDHERGIFVVHNGLIENFGELRTHHAVKGTERQVLSDTEVLSRLLADSIMRGLSALEAIRELTGMLKGRYALAFLFRTSPGTIYLVKNGSTLVAAMGKNEVFFASDILYLFPHTGESIPLEDGRIYTLRPGGLEMDRMAAAGGTCLRVTAAKAEGNSPHSSREGYEHFLLKEIYEQPGAVMDTLSEWIDNPCGLLDKLGLGRNINNIRRLHIVGCGTSYNVGLVGRYIIEKFVHIPVNVDISSEYRYMKPNITKGTYFIAISQSGETQDTIEAQRDARKQGAVVFALCNVAGSTSTKEADSVLYTRAGEEKGGASTKVYSAQLAALCLVGLALGIKKGTLHETEVETLKSLLLNLPGLIARALRNDKKISDIAGRLVDSKGFIYLGRGINYPVAIEGALKMKELSYIHAEAYPMVKSGSGPAALTRHSTPVIFLAPIESLDDDILHDMAKVKAMGGRVVAITDSPASMSGLADDLIVVPSIHPALLPFVTVVPLQLLAYHTARAKGCDIDRPQKMATPETDAH